MSTFTVTLPEYKFSLSFDEKRFTQRFPDSLITRTLDLTHEADIPINNLIVIPEVLQLLSQILTTEDYPYINAPDKSIRRALDYLGIDLPDPIYYPQFQQIINTEPDFVLQRILDDPNVHYQFILRNAQEFQFPELAKYLFDHTNPNDKFYQIIDYQTFSHLVSPLPATPISIQIAIMILERRNIASRLEDNANIPQWILEDKSPDLLQAYVKVNPNLINEFRIVDWILSDIRDYPDYYVDYVNMLLAIAPYVSGYQADLYNTFISTYNGDMETLSKYDVSDNPLLFVTALFRHHYAVAIYIFDEEKKYLDEIAPYTEISYYESAEKWFNSVITIYLSHPNWVTWKGLSIILDSLNILPVDLQNKYKSTLRNELNEKGRPDLSNIIK